MKKITISLSVIAVVAVMAVGATTAYFSDTETSTGNTFTAGSIDLKIDNTSYYNGVFNPDTSWLQPADLDSSHLFFDFDDLKPGDWGEDTISVHVDNNDSWLCADVTLTSDDDNGLTEPEEEDGDTTDGASNGELADNVTFVWWADDGDNVYEDDETLLPAGPLGFLDVGQTATIALADARTNIWGAVGDPLPGGDVRYIGKAWCFGDFVLNPVAQDHFGYTGDANNLAGTNGPDVRNAGVICDGNPTDNTTQSDSMTADITFSAIQSRHNENFVCQGTDIGCNEKTDTMLVLDSSGSISTDMTIVKNAAKAFVTALAPSVDGNHVGVVDFDSTASLKAHLTNDITVINPAIDSLIAGGSTAMGDGINIATTELANPGDNDDRTDATAPDFMVIVTDGKSNQGANPATAATTAKAAGTIIYVVGIGTGVDAAFLKTIATSPAHYFSAIDFSALEAILTSLANCS